MAVALASTFARRILRIGARRDAAAEIPVPDIDLFTGDSLSTEERQDKTRQDKTRQGPQALALAPYATFRVLCV